jgi:uncharacterized protein (TIGR00661 family)
MRLPDWIVQSRIILVAPLNWGLGHATRCMPIIRHLLKMEKEVIIASDGAAYHLLKKEFPGLKHHELPGYNIHYKYQSMTWNMMLQSWKILKGIKAEKKAISQLVNRYKVDTIISDNRYGVRHESCKNVIICHQINILHPSRIAAKVTSSINHLWINRFDECWIPDFPPPRNISGDLSNPTHIHHFHYIGAVSRFQLCDSSLKRDILVILSGPEPARSTLEKKLKSILKEKNYLMVRGVHSSVKNEDPRIINFMTAEDLNEAICSSKMIICRSGYTSLMDLIKLEKHAILIPTPGQIEQLYLAKVVGKQYSSYFQVVEESKLAGQLLPQLSNSL